MAKSRNLNHDERVAIITLVNTGLSISETARQCNVNRRTVQRLHKKYATYGDVDDLHRCGRPKVSSIRENRILGRMCTANPRLVAKILRNRWSIEYGVRASLATVKRRLVKMGLRGHIAKHKPFLSVQHRQRRLQWAKERANWSANEWQLCLFSDECPFPLIQMKQHRYIRCKINQRLIPCHIRPTMQAGGGHLMVWGAFSAAGFTSLAKVKGRINTETYLKLLNQHLLPLDLPGHGVLFQQDNAPAHKSRKTQLWLSQNNIETLPWPAQSPDLNPIENVWAYLKRRLEDREIHGHAELWVAIQEEWARIPDSFLMNLIQSMPRRIHAVIRAKGGATVY
jgi:transposase